MVFKNVCQHSRGILNCGDFASAKRAVTTSSSMIFASSHEVSLTAFFFNKLVLVAARVAAITPS